MFHLRVEPRPTGEFRVCADTFPIEDYQNETEAKALCVRLVAQQSRYARKGRRTLSCVLEVSPPRYSELLLALPKELTVA
jgi:hypothetical protein